MHNAEEFFGDFPISAGEFDFWGTFLGNLLAELHPAKELSSNQFLDSAAFVEPAVETLV